MAWSEKTMTDEEKVRISSNFILHSPPGELNEVFNDVRVLVNNDFLLKQGASSTFAQYNKEQLTPVKIDGSDFMALITDFNDLGSGRFYDPRSQQSFKYDHLTKEATDFKEWVPDIKTEPWRKAFEEACTSYVQDHYKHATCSVFSNSSDPNITLTACIENHQFQPKNFWNGSWRSVWSFTLKSDSATADIEGVIKIQVHYYEDGNVQLNSSKDVKLVLDVTHEQQTANRFISIVEKEETEYQTAMYENFQTKKSDATFKEFRRLLPVVRAKIDWSKILNRGKIRKELKNN